MNPTKGKKYDPTTYTNFYPDTGEKTQDKVIQELDATYRMIVIRTIDKKISEDGSNIDGIVHEIAINPRIKKHFEYLIKNGFNIEELFKSWYSSYKIGIKKSMSKFEELGK